MDTADDWRTRFRPDIPSPARIYDYLLGGKDNYPADRQAAEELLLAIPDLRMFAAENRAFMHRAVRYLVTEAGIRQFIDIGAGLPGQGNVHEIAQETDPAARVVYVDNDPVVLAHGRNMLQGVPNTAIIEHDLRQPGALLADGDLGKLIDFTEPVAVLMVAVLHFIDDTDNPAGLIAELTGALAPGSHLALSHATADSRPESAKGEKVYERATAQAHARNREQVRNLVGGLDLVMPGLVWAPQWRPEPGASRDQSASRSHVYAVVARKPLIRPAG
ncbi:MAG TPA: SAM-dependent methyltransferase [Streptosporangiaceae bacterium]